MSRILIVEDDAAILRGLEMNLQLEGFEVLTAVDGREGLARALNERIDLMVLDIMLPYINGYQILERARKSGIDVPVIMLSARNAEVDKVMGLDLGADDYVTKPFSVGELLARVKAHLRRHVPPAIVRWDDVEVDLERDLVRKGGEVVTMTAKEYELLKFLLQNEGRALTRESILDSVWGHGYFGTDRTVDNFITKLRQKFDTTDSKRFLTVRGVGYRFVLEPDSP